MILEGIHGHKRVFSCPQKKDVGCNSGISGNCKRYNCIYLSTTSHLRNIRQTIDKDQPYIFKRFFYRFLLQRKSEIGIAEATTLSNICIVDPAVELAIGKPTKPKKMVNFAIGIFLGLFSGIVFALKV